MIRWRTNIEYEAGQYPWIALLDVFFILLVFFLISNSVVFWPGTKLETALSLPTASSAKLQEADKLIVTITRSGQIFFNEKELDWHGLEQELDGRVLESVQASPTAIIWRMIRTRRRASRPSSCARTRISPTKPSPKSSRSPVPRIWAFFSSRTLRKSKACRKSTFWKSHDPA